MTISKLGHLCAPLWGNALLLKILDSSNPVCGYSLSLPTNKQCKVSKSVGNVGNSKKSIEL